MKRRTNVRVTADGTKGFFDRAREHARKLDRGEDLVPEITVSFADPVEMLRVLSVERIRVLRLARQRPTPVSGLAMELGRDTRAVSRDVDLLEAFGLIRTRYEKNPGHGRRRIVESPAKKYQLVATI